MTRNTTENTTENTATDTTENTDTDTDTAPAIEVETLTIGAGDGFRIGGLIGSVTFRASVTDLAGDTTPAAFIFRSAIDGAAVARSSAAKPAKTLGHSASTRPSETAAMLAWLGIDAETPTAETVNANERYRALRTLLSASAAAVRPVAVVFPADPEDAPTVSVDAETAVRLARAALGL